MYVMISLPSKIWDQQLPTLNYKSYVVGSENSCQASKIWWDQLYVRVRVDLALIRIMLDFDNFVLIFLLGSIVGR